MALWLLGAGGSPAQAANPVFPGYFADPEIRIFDQDYYIYSTTDGYGWVSPVYYVWKSHDLVNWTKSPPAMYMDSVHWGDSRYGAGWAPSVARANGKYYFYFVRTYPSTGVAVGDRPDGPFRDTLKQELAPGIDPMVFQDDDGKTYLYYSTDNVCKVARLNPDMISFAETPKEVSIQNFFEGVYVFKRKGKYYMMGSKNDFRTTQYCVYYGMGDSPYGPFADGGSGPVLQTRGSKGDSIYVPGPGHNSVLNIPGTDDWYIVYHRIRPTDSILEFHREVCIDTMRFDATGHIVPIVPTNKGVGPRTLDGSPVALRRAPASAVGRAAAVAGWKGRDAAGRVWRKGGAKPSGAGARSVTR